MIEAWPSRSCTTFGDSPAANNAVATTRLIDATVAHKTQPPSGSIVIALRHFGPHLQSELNH